MRNENLPRATLKETYGRYIRHPEKGEHAQGGEDT